MYRTHTTNPYLTELLLLGEAAPLRLRANSLPAAATELNTKLILAILLSLLLLLGLGVWGLISLLFGSS